MKADEKEIAILDRVRQELLAEGYDVVVHPNRLMVPSFLSGFVPDALAYRKDRNLVVEVTAQSPAGERRIKKLSELVATDPHWDLRLIWISAGETPRSLPVAGTDALQNTLNEVEALLEIRRPKAAFLLAWASLEAVARKLIPHDMAKPQTPARLIERLARQGYVTPHEAKTLRDLVSRRNRLIHGDLQTEIRRKYVGDMLMVLRRLVEQEIRRDTGAEESAMK